MTDDRRALLRSLFTGALEQPPEEREAWLAAATDDPELRAEVARLLQADAEAETTIVEKGVAELAAAVAEALEPEPTPSLAGRQVGPYRLLDEIGHGGMGTVYRAAREDVGGVVAVKVLRSGLGARDLRSRFLRERRILARLGHEHIARLLDAGTTEDGTPFFVMEHVEGKPLTEWVRDRGVDVAGRVRLFAQVCEAVRFAHAKLVVHRDLKPANILVTDAGVPKLLDFGIAKLLEDGAEEGLTRTGMLVFSPEYAAPEQLTGAPVTVATDVYALGILLCEILTGHRPYPVEGSSPMELTRSVLEARPRRPSTLVRVPGDAVGQISTDLDAICLKAIEQDPARRYESVSDLLRDVEAYLEGRPVEAVLPTLGYRLGKFVARNRAAVLAASAVVVSLVGGLGVSLWQAEEARLARDAAVEARAAAETAQQRSETVTDFFMDLLSANDPGEAQGEELTVREVLAAGVEDARALEGDSVLLAELLYRVGQVYNSLGSFDEAVPLLDEAVALRRTHLPPGHTGVVEVLNALGVSHALRGEAETAIEIFRTAADEGAAGAAGPEDWEVLGALGNQGVMLRRMGDLRGAEAVYERSLAAERRVVERDRTMGAPDLVPTLNNLAVVRHRLGDYREAEPLFREVLEVQAADGGGTPEHALAHINLALLLHDMGRWDEAGTLIRRGRAIQERILEPDHPDRLQGMQVLGSHLVLTGAPEEAAPLVDGALRGQREVLGPEHPATFFSLQTRGELLLARGDAVAAEAVLRDVIRLREANIGAENPDLVPSWMALARALGDQGREAEAETAWLRAEEVARVALPEDHPLLARVRVGWAALRADEDPDAARAALAEALPVLAERVGPEHPAVAEGCRIAEELEGEGEGRLGPPCRGS